MSILPHALRISVIASLALASAAFAADKRGSRENTPIEQAVPPDTLITLERTGCYGMCPIYKLSISADGNVVFEGERFVKKVGTSKSAISVEQIRGLLEAFDKINYFDLSDHYSKPDDGCTQWLTDNPSAITSITSNGRSKSVTHYYGCRGPEVLKQLGKLEQTIDDVVNSAQWIR